MSGLFFFFFTTDKKRRKTRAHYHPSWHRFVSFFFIFLLHSFARAIILAASPAALLSSSSNCLQRALSSAALTSSRVVPDNSRRVYITTRRQLSTALEVLRRQNKFNCLFNYSVFLSRIKFLLFFLADRKKDKCLRQEFDRKFPNHIIISFSCSSFASSTMFKCNSPHIIELCKRREWEVDDDVNPEQKEEEEEASSFMDPRRSFRSRCKWKSEGRKGKQHIQRVHTALIYQWFKGGGGGWIERLSLSLSIYRTEGSTGGKPSIHVCRTIGQVVYITMFPASSSSSSSPFITCFSRSSPI